jgi:HSP20 family protein
MTLFRFSPLDPVSGLLTLQRELERAFEHPLDFELGISGRGVFPPINIFSEQSGYLIRLEVPGLSPDQFSIETQGRTLTIKGKRDITAPRGGSFHRRERVSGEFSRSVQLPEDLDLGAAEASYKNGLLTIRIPKAAEHKPRQITVQVA